MSIHPVTLPETVVIDGVETTVYPGAARVRRNHRGTGYYPVTCGGYVIGSVQKAADGTWAAYQAPALSKSISHEEISHGEPTRGDALLKVRASKVARHTYAHAAHQGIFGKPAELMVLGGAFSDVIQL